MEQLAEGTMRRNKRTGEVQVLRGGQWVSQSAQPTLPTAIEGPPKEPPPQTPTQAAIDEERLKRLQNPPPSLPQGYRLNADGVAERIPGLPPAKGENGQALPPAVATDFETKVNAFGDLQRAINAFRDEYSGPGSGIENMAQGVFGVGTPGQRDWWADFKKIDNITRNALFGASLSEGERAAYAETTVTPNMRPEEVRRNLLRRLDLAKGILARRRDFLIANGYNPNAIQALMGDFDLIASPKDTTPREPGAETPPDIKEMSSEQKAAYEAFWRATKNPTPTQLSAFLSSIGIPNVEEADAANIIKGVQSGAGYSTAIDRREVLEQEIERTGSDTDVEILMRQGQTLGLSDEAAGIGRGLSKLFTGQNPVEGYELGRDAERFRIANARENLGGAGTALEIGGAFASGNINALAAPTLLGRMGQGARAGAVGGGIAGFGYGDGANSLLTGAGGAAVGGIGGAALPVAGQVISNRIDGFRRLTGRDPFLPRRLISEAIEADGNTPRAVGQIMDDARGRGSPMTIADTGDNARGLLASVGRQPGPSRNIVKTATRDRQLAQAERISSAVVRDLGPTANIRELGEELIERARAQAAPLYEKAYSAPGASVVKLDDLAARPSFYKALRNAVNLAQEEGVDPTALGFRFNDAGEMALDREAISWRTMDYIKRGLDDVVEGYRDKTTGKLQLDGQGRATNATLRTLLARMDKVNPDYAAARAAYAGPAKMREAMERGVRALSKSPDDILAQMKGLGEAETEAYRLGVRKAIIELVNSRKDGGDKVSVLLGTPKSRAVLSRIFGGNKEFDRFIATLRDEEAMGATYRAVHGNSATAERLADDAATNDTGLAESAFDAVLRGSKDSLWGSVVAALQKLREVDKFGAGKAGERTRESIAALLSETDPAVLRELVTAAQRARAQQRVRTGRQSRQAINRGRTIGNVTGMALGRTTERP